MKRKRITAFGSSRLDSHDPRYQDIQYLGKTLAEIGWDAVTGGGGGLMAAFAGGIRDGGGHVRGITLGRFARPPVDHLSEEIRARDFFHRMQGLIEETDAYIALPGGLGTLAELAMTWDLLAIRVLEPRPLILYGQDWLPVIRCLEERLIFSVDRARLLIHVCTTPQEVRAHLSA